jgi:2-polyprenyl-3-methyl-5-hydroxy-6-metoxy-1,4-benzoquinol methylase
MRRWQRGNGMDYSKYFQRGAAVKTARGHVVSLYAKFPWLARVFREIGRLPHGARVLDIGCGEGQFLATVRRMRPDLQLEACDLQNALAWPELEGVAFHRLDLESGTLEGLPTGVFDFVSCQHVVEHLIHPETVFAAAYHALAPGGRLYVEAPDIRLTYIPHIPWLTGHRGQLNFWDDPTHRRPFTRPALRRLAQLQGFTGISSFHARRYGHLAALPGALFTLDDDYKLAFLQAVFGLFIAVTGNKPATPDPEATA